MLTHGMRGLGGPSLELSCVHLISISSVSLGWERMLGNVREWGVMSLRWECANKQVYRRRYLKAPILDLALTRA
jgi:hypothetical protein